MNRKKTLFLLFAFLSFAQVDYAQEYNFYLQKARQRLAEGDCTRAEASYNTYKDLTHNTNKEIEQLIEECKSGGFVSDNEALTGAIGGHDYVELGLPSGTLWATCNLGASKPEGYGNYYAWGETKTKSTYNFSTYKYVNGDYDKLTKYCNRSDYGNNGFTDNLTDLQTSDDPAAANWGSGWRTPSKAQWDELLTNTTNQWTTRNGVKGREFTSKKNGAKLFLPAAGGRSEFRWAGFLGGYWSRSLYTDTPFLAWGLRIYSDDCYMGYDYRSGGFTVRPVREK